MRARNVIIGIALIFFIIPSAIALTVPALIQYSEDNKGATVIPAPPAEPPMPTGQIEWQVFLSVNQERQKAGLDSLLYDETVSDIARTRSLDMAENDYFSHITPSGENVEDISRWHCRQWIGENIAFVPSEKEYGPIEHVVGSWMDSDGHKEVILSDNYVATGVGAVRGGEGIYITQVFC